MSSHLQWMIVRNNSCFLRKTKHCNFSRVCLKFNDFSLCVDGMLFRVSWRILCFGGELRVIGGMSGCASIASSERDWPVLGEGGGGLKWLPGNPAVVPNNIKTVIVCCYTMNKPSHTFLFIEHIL